MPSFDIIITEKEIQEEYQLKTVIDIYESVKRKNYYVEEKQVVNGQVLSASPLNVEKVKDVFNYLFQSNKNKKEVRWKGIIPKNVIFYEPETLIWNVLPGKRKLFFQDKETLNKEYLIPGLVFILKGTSLNVYAYKGVWIEDEDDLYLAPFPNINSSGNVCMGNMDVEYKNTYEETINKIQDDFFNSIFTHENQNLIKSKSLFAVYRKMAITGKPFPEEELIKYKSLKQIINECYE